MPSLVVLQSAHNKIFDFLVDEAARYFVHFVTHYDSACSHRCLLKTKCSLCSNWICSALFSQTNKRDDTSVSFKQPFMLAREWAWYLLAEVCNDVCIEPCLQPLSGETLNGASSNAQDGARLDIAASGFWGRRFERTYFDVRVFNPLAPSHRQCNLSTCYRKQENLKKRAYEQRVREVEHSSFAPLVLSASGGLANEAKIFYRRLASFLAASKWDQPYSSTLSWLHTRLTFSLLRSAIQCIRGTRSHSGRAFKAPSSLDLVVSETQLSY